MKLNLNYSLKFNENEVPEANLLNDIERQNIRAADSLCSAAKRGDLEKIQLMINMGVNIDTKTKSGLTPLCLAVENQHINVAEFLIDGGADMNFKTPGGDPILHKAIGRIKLDIAKLMISKGANLNIRNAKNESPLHSASKWGYLLLARLLLEAGANTEVETYDNLKPLHISVVHGFIDIAKLLIEYNAEVSTAFVFLQEYTGDNESREAMHILLSQASIVDLLCKKRINDQEDESLKNNSIDDLLSDIDQNMQSTFSHRVLYKAVNNKLFTASELIQVTDCALETLSSNIKDRVSNLYFLVRDIQQVLNDINLSSIYNEVGRVESLFKKTLEALKKYDLWEEQVINGSPDIIDKAGALARVENFLASVHITLLPEPVLNADHEMLALEGLVGNGSEEM